MTARKNALFKNIRNNHSIRIQIHNRILRLTRSHVFKIQTSKTISLIVKTGKY